MGRPLFLAVAAAVFFSIVPSATVAADAPGSDPDNIVAVGDTVFFRANDGTHGSELWKSDGTAEGTELVKDVDPAVPGICPCGLTPVGAKVFYGAKDGTHGYELWVSDGTDSGTAMVKDITPGAGTTGIHIPTAVGPELFFAVEGTPASDMSLWKSDGTEAGTTEVRPLGGSVLDSPPGAVALGSTLYFLVSDVAHGFELWKSDGTAEGTSIVIDLNPGPDDGVVVGELRAWGSQVYFPGDDGVHGTELWTTDGTAAGTHLVKNINRGAASSWPAGLTTFGDLLLFAADNGATHGQELWRTDGTRAGTALVKDITPLGHRRSRPYSITPIGQRALFTAFADRVLYRTDGTAGGTHIVRRPRNGGPIVTGPQLVRVNGIGVLFEAAVRALWKSNGWRNGTVGILDVAPSEITALGPSFALFAGDDGVHGRELWATDGSSSGTHMVADINP